MTSRLSLSRVLSKKRGDHGAISSRIGRFGEGIFFLACLAVGTAALIAILFWVTLPNWRVNQHFVETTCRIVEIPRAEQRSGSAENVGFRPMIPFEYDVAGTTFRADNYDLIDRPFADQESAESVAAEFKLGENYPCWYDPNAPAQVVLARWNWFSYWIALLLPTALIAVGAGGLGFTVWQTAVSRERRAALVQKAADVELFHEANNERADFPTIPTDAELKNSPGTTLAYRLPMETSSGWKMFTLATICLGWNGLVMLFAVLNVNGHLAGHSDWYSTTAVIAFASAGIWLVIRTIRQFWRASRTAPTRVEISEHPLAPGGQCELFVAQTGKLDVNSFDVLLVCEEEATFRQGTDTVTSTGMVSADTVFSKERFEIDGIEPYEVRCPLRVPDDAMHSFRAAHNVVQWKLLVRSNVNGRRNSERSFPIVVVPGGNGMGRDNLEHETTS